MTTAVTSDIPLAERARAVLADLIAFDTTSRNSNLPLIDYAEAKLKALGARTRRIPTADGLKANLWAVIGPDAPGGVVLSGHTDVVPVDGQAWDTDPWSLTERNGRLYGRGTSDMKCFVATALAAAEDFAGAHLSRPIHFAFSHDEEVGCLGAPAMIDVIASEAPPIEAVIVGEPSEMKVISGHKGLLPLSVTLKGKEAHSSLLGDGACAVTHAVPIMAHILSIGEAMAQAAPADSPFDPPAGTLTIGQVRGGAAINILAGDAEFSVMIRPAPWDDGEAIMHSIQSKADEVQTLMRQTAPEALVTVSLHAKVPPLKPEQDGAAERLARALTGDNALRVASYGAEGGQFQQAGFSTVICGPGSIAQAHQPNEFIELSQVAAGADFMLRLCDHMRR